MSKLRIAVIGDHFMKAHFFSEALHAALPDAALDIRTLELDWPDTPMAHGYSEAAANPDLEGLKEYLGDPLEMAAFIGDAEVLVDHLAPVTAGLLQRCPQLKGIASRENSSYRRCRLHWLGSHPSHHLQHFRCSR